MTTLSARLTLHIPWANSLKDKRQVSRSLTQKTRQKFNVSIAEVDTPDLHRRLTLGIAALSGTRSQASALLEAAIRFVESATEAELLSVEYVD
ncbi:MAG: DUF503 domain-containing protein [Clostridiales bacterium]|nr:DUF503 domain-containing protein [Clostridiales bacterium]